MSRLTWAKARPVIGRLFKDWPPQWLQRFAPMHLARLQWPNAIDPRSFEDAISMACTAGELAHETGEFEGERGRVASANPSIWADPDAARYHRAAPPATATHPAIAAPDFVAWLRTQRETPSEHIAAWMEATAPEPAPVVLEREVPAHTPAAVAEDAPLPLTTGDVAFAFAGLRYTEAKWKKPLGDKPKWLATCVAIPGRRGVRETRWNPVHIGGALVRAGHVAARSVRARFQTQPLLMPWRDTWDTYEADYIDSV